MAVLFATVKELWKLINIWLSYGQQEDDTDIFDSMFKITYLHTSRSVFHKVVRQRLKWCDKYYLGFLATTFLFTTVKEFWKSVNIWQSYNQQKGDISTTLKLTYMR